MSNYSGSGAESNAGSREGSPARSPSPASSAGGASVASSYRGDVNRYNPNRAILNNLKDMYNEAETADITLIIGEKRFPAHKTILMASSSYFRNMFMGPWKESNSTEVRLEDTDECKAVFDIFLSFFYGTVLKFSKENVLPILTLADKYDAKELKRLCEVYMIGFIAECDLEHAMEWLPLGERFNMDNLKAACQEIIAFNFEEASRLPLWKDFTMDQVALILDTQNLVAVDEFMVYTIIQKKLMEETSKTKINKNARQILPLIQFKMMAAQDLVKVEKSELAKILPQTLLKGYLAEAYRYIALKGAGAIKEDEESTSEENEGVLQPKSRLYTKGFAVSHFDEGRSDTPVNIKCDEYREIVDQEWVLVIGRWRHYYVIELYDHARRSNRNLPRELTDARYKIELGMVTRDYRARVISVERSTVENLYLPLGRGDTFAQIEASGCWCGEWRERRNFRCSCKVPIHNILYSITATRTS